MLRFLLLFILSLQIPLHACPADTSADDKSTMICDGGLRMAKLNRDEVMLYPVVLHFSVMQRSGFYVDR